MKKTMKKFFSAVLSSVIALTSVIMPMSAMAATTLTAETNKITSSKWYNISYYNGTDYINMEFENVDKDGKIHVEPGETPVVVINSGAYASSSDNRLNEISWHYRNNYDADGVTTDVTWSAKTDGWMPATVSGFGSSTSSNPKAAVNSTEPVTTTITTSVYDQVGEHSLEISYKYQMKYQEWYSFKTGKETGANASTINFKIVVENAAPKPVHQHTYDKVVTAPTCTTDGYTTYICNNSDGLGSIGDDTYTANEKRALGHDYKNSEVISNNDGTHKIKCVRFDECKTYSNNENCTYSYAVVTSATATATGLGKYTCTKCGYSYTDIIPIVECTHDGSTHIENAKNATCTENGYTGDIVCDICKNVIKIGETINATSHKEKTRVENEVKGNCVTAGSYDKVTYCSECNTVLNTEKVTTTVDSTNHVGDTQVINKQPASCKDNGYTGDTICSSCRAVIQQGTAIDKSTVAHTNGSPVKENEIAGTCAKEGSYDSVVYCTVCNTEISRETIATEKNPDNHSGESVLKGKVNPTYDEYGYTGDVCCKDCGAVLEKGTQIDKLHEVADPSKPSEKPTESTTKPTTTTQQSTTQQGDKNTSTEKNTTTTANKDSAVKNNSRTSPKTGAETDHAVMIFVVAIASAVLVLVVAKKKKFAK